MGVSILVEWPGSSEDQRRAHPGLRNDDHLWVHWVMDLLGKPQAISQLEELGLGLLLHFNTAGLTAEDIDWETPGDFERAALALRDLIAAKDPRVQLLIDVYRKEWNRIVGEGQGQVEEWFGSDLEDIAGIARYAQAQGASKMTLGYYW